jgi:hypothetical protein
MVATSGATERVSLGTKYASACWGSVATPGVKSGKEFGPVRDVPDIRRRCDAMGVEDLADDTIGSQ